MFLNQKEIDRIIDFELDILFYEAAFRIQQMFGRGGEDLEFADDDGGEDVEFVPYAPVSPWHFTLKFQEICLVYSGFYLF